MMQAGIRKMYKERVLQDMVTKHKQSPQGRRRLRLAPTVNAEFANKFEKLFTDVFGVDGSKLAAMDNR